jgi:hypothetical protein
LGFKDKNGRYHLPARSIYLYLIKEKTSLFGRGGKEYYKARVEPSGSEGKHFSCLLIVLLDDFLNLSREKTMTPAIMVTFSVTKVFPSF